MPSSNFQTIKTKFILLFSEYITSVDFWQSFQKTSYRNCIHAITPLHFLIIINDKAPPLLASSSLYSNSWQYYQLLTHSRPFLCLSTMLSLVEKNFCRIQLTRPTTLTMVMTLAVLLWIFYKSGVSKQLPR